MVKIYKTEKNVKQKHYIYWVVVWRDITGKRNQKNFKYEKEAKKFARKLSNDINPPESLRSNTFAAISEEFIADCLKGRLGRSPLEPTTVENYRRYLRQYTYKYIGDRRLKSIDYKVGMDLRDKFLEDAPSRITAQNAFKVFKSVMNYALERQLISINPVSSLHIKKDNRERTRGTRTFEPDEVSRLIEFAEKLRVGRDPEASKKWKIYSPLIQVAAFCGLRASEIRGLTVDSLNFSRKTVSVLGKMDKFGKFTRAKSKNAYRTVPVPEDTLEQMHTLLLEKRSDWVFSNETGGPIDHQNFLKRAWYPLRRLAVVREIEFHALRHFYASCLISSGATLKELHTMLGHADPAFTLRVYGHLFEMDDEKRQEMVSQITRLVGFDEHRFSNWRKI